MNPKDQIPKPNESLDELDLDTTPSVDDFIKELEAKEKDLQITSDLTIELDDPEIDTTLPAFIQQDLKPEAPVVPDARSAGLKTRVYELENEIEGLQAKISLLRAERNEIQEKSDRRLKDFENYKYRMDRERRGAFIDQISNLASQMLPVLDNLDRALDSVEAVKKEKSPEFQHFYDGIVLVNQQVNEILGGMGVQPITTVGETFDPNFHEAVAISKRDDLAPNTVCDEMLRGYRIGNRVIRHSMVKVSAAAAARQTRPDLPDLDPETSAEKIASVSSETTENK